MLSQRLFFLSSHRSTKIWQLFFVQNLVVYLFVCSFVCWFAAHFFTYLYSECAMSWYLDACWSAIPISLMFPFGFSWMTRTEFHLSQTLQCKNKALNPFFLCMFSEMWEIFKKYDCMKHTELYSCEKEAKRLFFLPSESDVMLLTTNSRNLLSFVFTALFCSALSEWCMWDISIVYTCCCRIVNGCGAAAAATAAA